MRHVGWYARHLAGVNHLFLSRHNEAQRTLLDDRDPLIMMAVLRHRASLVRYTRSDGTAGQPKLNSIGDNLRQGGNMGDVRIPVSSGELPVFVAVPEQGAPWPGVVVLHDVAGMTEDLRNQARWLAREGFLAAAPNLFFRGAR